MKDVKATRSGKVTEDSIEQAARASERTTSEFGKGASRMKDAAARAGDQAMRASVGMIQRNAETVLHTLQGGAKLAARMTERSADQLGRAIGFSGEGAQKAAQKSSHNIEGIVQSGTLLSEITQRLREEWADIAQARIDRGFDRIDALLQCRTPQDFAALQSELLRDNMETFLGYACKAGEHSARLADEAKQRFGSVAEVMASRQHAVRGHGQTAQRKPEQQTARRKLAQKRSARVGEAKARRGGPSRKAHRAG
jgi:hypothetical protein